MPGACQHQTTATERYQNPGLGSTCGAPTFHAVDVPEKVRVDAPDGSVQFRETGHLLARENPDTHCPAHGGTPDPNNPQSDAPSGDLGDALTQAFGLIRQHASNLAVARGGISSLEDRVKRVEAWIEEHTGGAPAPAAAAGPSTSAAAQDAPTLAPWQQAAADAAQAVNAPPAAEAGEISHGPRPGWGQSAVSAEDAAPGGEPSDRKSVV